MYQIIVKKSALKELDNIPKQFRIKILVTIEELAIDPRPNGVRKLESYADTYRVRVGNYRVVYQIEGQKLLINVVKIADRKEAYRNK